MYLDCSIVVHDRTKAEALCRQYNERAYYDLAGGTDVYVKAIEKGRGDEEAALRASDIPERRDATTDGERDTRSGGFASPGDRESPDIGELASKFNPYHDQLGRFTSGPGGHGTLRSVHNSRQPFNSLFLASSLFRASVAWAPAIAPSNEPIWHCRRRNNRRAKSNR